VIEGDRLPTLEAERVRLRWLDADDAPALFDVFSDTEVARYLSRPAWTDVAAARELIEAIDDSFARRDLFQWGIARRDTDRIVGTCTLAAVDAAHGRAELGYALARSSWGEGIAREAVQRLLDFAFDGLGLHRIEAGVDSRNARSIALLENLGFQREGRLRERWHVQGERCDGLFFGLLRRERAILRSARSSSLDAVERDG
jgi:RimJ/RimL family protein N-acetyltransferase